MANYYFSFSLSVFYSQKAITNEIKNTPSSIEREEKSGKTKIIQNQFFFNISPTYYQAKTVINKVLHMVEIGVLFKNGGEGGEK